MNLKIIIMITLAFAGGYAAWWFFKELTKDFEEIEEKIEEKIKEIKEELTDEK